MNEKLKTILDMLEEAKRQLADAKMNDADSDFAIMEILEDVDAELDDIREKLGRLKKMSP